jgi:hypothetical protein
MSAGRCSLTARCVWSLTSLLTSMQVPMVLTSLTRGSTSSSTCHQQQTVGAVVAGLQMMTWCIINSIACREPIVPVAQGLSALMLGLIT